MRKYNITILIGIFASFCGASYLIAPATPIFPSSSIPAFIQSKQATGNTVTSLAASFSSLPKVGNIVIAAVATNGINDQTQNVVDNQGNSYSRLMLIPNNLTAATRGSLWCGVVKASSGTFTVTESTVTANSPLLLLGEYKNGTCGIDTSSSAIGNTSPYSCGSITTRNANDLLIAFLEFNFGGGGTVTYTPPTGFTARESQTNGALIPGGSFADDIVSATGTFASTYGTSQNNINEPCLQVALLSH